MSPLKSPQKTGKHMYLNDKKERYFEESRMINPEDVSRISEIVLDFIKKVPEQVIYYLRCCTLIWDIKAVIADMNLKVLFTKLSVMILLWERKALRLQRQTQNACDPDWFGCEAGCTEMGGGQKEPGRTWAGVRDPTVRRIQSLQHGMFRKP